MASLIKEVSGVGVAVINSRQRVKKKEVMLKQWWRRPISAAVLKRFVGTARKLSRLQVL
jgi:hypothetical protein